MLLETQTRNSKWKAINSVHVIYLQDRPRKLQNK
jgi:hypothetical protein